MTSTASGSGSRPARRGQQTTASTRAAEASASTAAPPASTESIERFFPELFELLGPAIVQSLPIIVHAIQGDPQQRDATRDMDSREAEERSLTELLSLVFPILNQCIPVFVQQVQQLQQQPQRGTVPIARDDEAIERFWPALLAELIPVCVNAVPTLINALSGGSRAQDGVRATDREVGTRFLGPLLSVLVPAFLNNLPDLIATITGERDVPTDTFRSSRGLFQLIPITLNDLVAFAGRLPDRDQVNAALSDTTSGTTEFVLQTAAHITWWKGLQVVDASDNQVDFIETWGSNHESGPTVVDSRVLRGGGSVVLWKAKAFGIHTPMYRMNTGDINVEGKRVTLFWNAD